MIFLDADLRKTNFSFDIIIKERKRPKYSDILYKFKGWFFVCIIIIRNKTLFKNKPLLIQSMEEKSNSITFVHCGAYWIYFEEKSIIFFPKENLLYTVGTYLKIII